MPVNSRTQLLKIIKSRKYLNRDFDGFRKDLEDFGRTYFGDKIKDFTPNSVAGMFLDFASYIGDVQSFYLDHLFHEASPESAVEPRNIERHLRDNGVPIIGASPAVVDVSFIIKVPADISVNPPIPLATTLPVILAATSMQSDAGIQFELFEDVDFGETDRNGNLLADVVIGDVDTNNNPITFILTRTGTCLSGQRTTDSFSVGDNETFRRFTLSKENITEVISVRDSNGTEYYEVEFLTQDTVFKAVLNRGTDNDLVKDNLQIIPAPYRFYKAMNISTRLTTLTFGGGTAQSIDNDIVPDPSEFSLPLYGKRTFSRFSLNPTNLLRTSTLGVINSNVSITIEYRYGGGLSHNVSARTIRNLVSLNIDFPRNPTPSDATFVRQSLQIRNESDASGGTDAPTLDDLKLLIPSFRASQSRIVTKEDALARIFTLPSNFGRVFRAAFKANPNNPNAAQLFIISKNANDQLVVAPDALKKNLSTFLNQYRLVSDAVDILDAQVINLQLEYQIIVDPAFNRQLILQNVNAKLKEYFNIKNYEIDQPISLSDIQNIIYNNIGIISVQNIRFTNIVGQHGSNLYSTVQFDIPSNTFKGLIIPLSGGIFELRFKNSDIIGSIG